MIAGCYINVSLRACELTCMWAYNYTGNNVQPSCCCCWLGRRHRNEAETFLLVRNSGILTERMQRHQHCCWHTDTAVRVWTPSSQHWTLLFLWTTTFQYLCPHCCTFNLWRSGPLSCDGVCWGFSSGCWKYSTWSFFRWGIYEFEDKCYPPRGV